MLCREQFLKHPPEKLSQHILIPNPSDVDNNKVHRTNKNIYVVSDDASNWMTDNDDDNDEVAGPSQRRRKNYAFTIQKQIELRVMRDIFEAQTNEVKKVILSLQQMQLNQIKAKCNQPLTIVNVPRLFSIKKRNKSKQLNTKNRVKVVSAGAVTFSYNQKFLARLQRRRHFQRKPKKQKNRKKFPRRKRRSNAKAGNRQNRKRILRSQKYFNKGIFFTGHRWMDEILKSIKDPNGYSKDFCYNNGIQGLSKLHLQQIAAYERIEEDLQRLSITREERTKAAEERKAKELEKAELRKDLKNRIEAKVAANAENNELKKERRAVRKKRALDKKLREQTAKAEIRLFCKSVV